MRLQDVDNMVAINLHPEHEEVVRVAVRQGKVTDCCGDPIEWGDCLDALGDLCVDEDAYDQIKTLLQL